MCGRYRKYEDGAQESGISILNSNIDKIVFFNRKAEYKCTSTDYEYTNLSVTIPANCVYSIGARQTFSYSKPTGIALAKSDMNSWNVYAIGSSNCCSVSGYTEEELTLSVYAKWEAVGMNRVTLGGFYRKI